MSLHFDLWKKTRIQKCSKVARKRINRGGGGGLPLTICIATPPAIIVRLIFGTNRTWLRYMNNKIMARAILSWQITSHINHKKLFPTIGTDNEIVTKTDK